MNAKRIDDKNFISRNSETNLFDGTAICYWRDEDGLWWIYLPGCGAGVLSNHSVQEHEDRTITVSPSVLMMGHKDGTPTQRHGFLERGIWREV